ncbi:Pro-Pol polyprotein, partial [Stegodyphus mimosarum]
MICGERVKQVALPLCKREYFLKIAHNVPLAGLLGEQKMNQRIKFSCYWPTIKSDVKKYCESCRQCPLRKMVANRDRILIQPIVRPENPFEIWSVDCIGPLEPSSHRVFVS